MTELSQPGTSSFTTRLVICLGVNQSFLRDVRTNQFMELLFLLIYDGMCGGNMRMASKRLVVISRIEQAAPFEPLALRLLLNSIQDFDKFSKSELLVQHIR